MPVGPLVARTPQEIKVVEIQTHIIPAAVTGMIVYHPVRSFKLIGRMGESGDHHHRNLTAPCQPAQTAGQTDEKVRIFNEIYPLL